ncbi:MAG TPA: winged helix-turn-helix domain-containing protein [Candidatus Sulfotelmatobacter sp.]|nr:winged helix-turn-helix domain-containing protein [Candidatus Sulfotelmatobacter sp.]
MVRMARIRVGDWCVDPAAGEISRDGVSARLDARGMRLLLHLAKRPGEVVSIEDLLAEVWAGVNVSQDSVYQAVTSLRRLLGDDPKQPRYIATVPRLGYRMVAEVAEWQDGEGTETTRRGRRDVLKWAAGFAICLVVVLGFLFRGRIAGGPSPAVVASQRQKSVAVLPFLDLTPGMTEGEFADGMTEELIDKLSKLPGLRVPAPTSSFYFKDKKIPVAEIAKSLGVTYVLDGSVRKSGGRVRIAARFVRADNGYVMWSETYERPFDDVLMVQDEIAGEVTKALRESIQ